MDPVEITDTAIASCCPSRMMAPLPNWRSICTMAVSRAFNLS